MKQTEQAPAHREEAFTRKDISFGTEDYRIRGWLYLPAGEDLPVIVMAHGFGALKEMYLDRYAERFAGAGFAVVVFDYRSFGDSDGLPRNEVNPWRQIDDYRHAITYAGSIAEVDENRIGIWGTSYSGGHVLAVAAADKRVRCAVSQVPTVSGTESSKRRVPAEQVQALHASFQEDRLCRMEGGQPAVRTVASLEAADRSIYGSGEAADWYMTAGMLSPNWTNEVTLRSVEYSRWYDPGHLIEMVSPVPLLMIVGTEDTVTPADLALKAYEKALEPKRLALLRGGHFDPYVKEFDYSSGEAVRWFKQHLEQAMPL
ncbi:alpha/beta hydrolase [Sporosarcina sp. P1]|uniref:alpha/beta hydrolase n=1 Tax=Sporosarcina sp. P1 TaxID=2048257 RepID=UPI000C16DB1C|nr:alpha/beta hydrolase [Sporosarcina sp. P1]PIC83005.1 acetylxylan esterase [Sporosarcina sp. P1]